MRYTSVTTMFSQQPTSYKRSVKIFTFNVPNNKADSLCSDRGQWCCTVEFMIFNVLKNSSTIDFPLYQFGLTWVF